MIGSEPVEAEVQRNSKSLRPSRRKGISAKNLITAQKVRSSQSAKTIAPSITNLSNAADSTRRGNPPNIRHSRIEAILEKSNSHPPARLIPGTARRRRQQHQNRSRGKIFNLRTHVRFVCGVIVAHSSQISEGESRFNAKGSSERRAQYTQHRLRTDPSVQTRLPRQKMGLTRLTRMTNSETAFGSRSSGHTRWTASWSADSVLRGVSQKIGTAPSPRRVWRTNNSGR